MTARALFLLALAAGAASSQSITFDAIPAVPGTRAVYARNRTPFTWPAFDSSRHYWDLTGFPSSGSAVVSVVEHDPALPAPLESLRAERSGLVEIDSLGSTVQRVLLLPDSQGLYTGGIDFTQAGYRFVGRYAPEACNYWAPLERGSAWMSAVSWQCELCPGIPYTASEQHSRRVVGRGKVRVPASGSDFWPCLVVQDSMTYSDNFGTADHRWVYEWLVPGMFGGANGVAAAMSEAGAGPDFTRVATLTQLSGLVIPDRDLTPPVLAALSPSPDTEVAGPLSVSAVIHDDTELGAESLFYRTDNGPWNGLASESATGDTFRFSIPAPATPCRVEYYLWAIDRFASERGLDLWTTLPACAPESTVFSYRATGAASSAESVPDLASALPNPFQTATVFYYANPLAHSATVKVFATSGELIRTLEMTPAPGPAYFAEWDGRNESGQLVPAGTYLYRVESEGHEETSKVLVTR